MSFLAKLVLLCVLVALLQKAVLAALIGLALAWTYWLVTEPKLALTHLVILTALVAFRAYPGWSLVGFAVLLLTASFSRIAQD